MTLSLALLLLVSSPTLADETEEPQEEAQDPEEAETPALDPALVTWYQDMRIACSDRRTSIVSRYQASSANEPGEWFGTAAWSAAARGGVVSWQAAADPRVDDDALARTPDVAGAPSFSPRQGAPSPTTYGSLPANITGKLHAIELAQGEADEAWRAWQAVPREEERSSLVERLETLQELCSGVD